MTTKLCVISPIARRLAALAYATVAGVEEFTFVAYRTTTPEPEEEGDPPAERPATHCLASGGVADAVLPQFAAGENVIVRATADDVTPQDITDVKSGGFILVVEQLWQEGANVLAEADKIGLYGATSE